MRGELIGKGTYSRVYLALDTTTGEMVSVKEVEAPKSKDDRDIQHQMSLAKALKAESSLLQELDHPHIVQYLGFEETSDVLSM